MDVLELVKIIAELGIIPALLIFFIWNFFEKDKHREKKLDDMYDSFKDRENILIAEGTRREELLRTESAKMEKLMRTESEKRENMLMATIERQGNTMEKIADTMKQIEISHVHVLTKIDNIETSLEKMRCDNERT